MPTGCGPAVGMPPATNDVLATWKISNTLFDTLVKYSSPVFLLKIASPIWLCSARVGSGFVTPATTRTVSAFAVPNTTPLTVEYAQFRAAALSHA